MACAASSNAVVVPTGAHSVKKPRFSDQNRAKGFPSVRTSVPQQEALQKAFLFDHTESCHAWLRWRLATVASSQNSVCTLFRVFFFGLYVVSRFRFSFQSPVRRRFWSENIVLKEPNFTRRNDGKDPLLAVSCSNAIIRRKELFERAVGKSC